MSNTFQMPKILGDGRLDTILFLLHQLGTSDDRESPVTLDWNRTTQVTPAGHAILSALIDTATEYGKEIDSIDVPRWLTRSPLFQLLGRAKKGRLLLAPEKLSLQQPCLLSVRNAVIDQFFGQRVKERFEDRLSEDLVFGVQLIVNELMQNSVDHAAAERYYLYAGLSENEFHVGILDMGITIPAKLERKYSAKDDTLFLKLAFRKGIGTRRTREGGLGLWHIYDVVKRNRGRLVLISRNAQFRHYFETRRSQINLLKHPLLGTWCMVRFPVRSEK
jgi:hypothetical protein